MDLNQIKETLNALLKENFQTGERRLNQYLLQDLLGRGSYGVVYKALDTEKNLMVAIKEYNKQRLRRMQLPILQRRIKKPPMVDGMDLIKHELAIYKKLNHPNVIKLYEVLDSPESDLIFMVFEMCDGPILFMDNPQPICEEKCRQIMIQLFQGIEYLHEHDICHRDIKPDNLLWKRKLLKIVDFGVSEIFQDKNDQSNKSCGSPAFFAPELCVSRISVQLKPADIWAIGVTCYYLLLGKLPFQGDSLLELYDSIRNQNPKYPESFNKNLIQFLDKLLCKDPTKRMTVSEFRDDPWITMNNAICLTSKLDNLNNIVTEVTENDIEATFCSINSLMTVLKAVNKLKKLKKRDISQ